MKGRWPGVAALLACAVWAGCAHSPPASATAPAPQAADRAQVIHDLGGDPFDEPDAGPPKPAPAAPIAAPAPPPPSDPRALDDAAVRARLGSDCPDIHAALREHLRASPKVVREALAAAERCEERTRDLRSARATARSLLLACGPEHVAACRTHVLSVWRHLAAQAPRDRRLLAQAQAVSASDACLRRVERQAVRARSLDGCLSQADHVYRGAHDGLQHARVKLAQARFLARIHPRQAESALSASARACTEPRCSEVTAHAIEAYARWAMQQHRPELVLELWLRHDALIAQSLPPALRVYARSAHTDAACAALDVANGPGRCRALEWRTLGHYTFHDASLRDVPGDLPKDQIVQIGEDFKVSLQGCLREEAERLPVPAPQLGPVTERVAVRWMVTPEGRVAQMHLDPPAPDDGPLATCLRGQFAIWRYPRSHGEDAQVEQTFTVSATAR